MYLNGLILRNNILLLLFTHGILLKATKHCTLCMKIRFYCQTDQNAKKLLLVQLTDEMLISITVKIYMHLLPCIYTFLQHCVHLPISFQFLRSNLLIFLMQKCQEVMVRHNHHQPQILHHLEFNVSKGRIRYGCLPCSSEAIKIAFLSGFINSLLFLHSSLLKSQNM